MARLLSRILMSAALVGTLAAPTLGHAQGTTPAAKPPAQVLVREIEVGDGDTAVDGTRVTVQYVGYLTDGTQFDSSYKLGRPFSFTLGLGEVIRGWDLGIRGMRVGGRRELLVPPSLAYGDKGASDVVPPGATLRYEIELLKVEGATFTPIAADVLKGELGTVKVIDIRPESRRAETGTIAGSIAIVAFDEKGVLNRAFLARLLDVATKTDAIVLVDDDGRRARYMGTFLTQNAGFSKLTGLDGGLDSWSAKGYPLTKE